MERQSGQTTTSEAKTLLDEQTSLPAKGIQTKSQAMQKQSDPLASDTRTLVNEPISTSIRYTPNEYQAIGKQRDDPAMYEKLRTIRIDEPHPATEEAL